MARAAVAAALACMTVAGSADAHCRTTTCKLPPNFAPTEGTCYPDGFEAYCASLDPPVRILPVYWRNACISYDIQENASVQVPYPNAAQMFEAAFSKWTSTICPAATQAGQKGDTGDAAPWGRVSIDVRDFGPVACDKVQFNSAETGEGNQHVIIFYDHDWPHDSAVKGAADVLGLTTISFDPDTGELYDADMEINSTIDPTAGVPLWIPGSKGPVVYDFESIITHETGHFLGMAHSGATLAAMTANYTAGTTFMRTLKPDDQAGICAIYHPDGTRAVAPGVAPDALLPEDACDPTPQHGFQSACGQPSSGCSAAAGAVRAGGVARFAGLAVPASALGLAAAMSAVRRRRRRRAGPHRMW